MEHPYGEQYGQEGNPRAYMTMRDYRDLPYQWQQPQESNPREYMTMRDYRNLAWQNQQPWERNPNPPRSMRDYRDHWMSAPSYMVPPQYAPPEPPCYAPTSQQQQLPPLSPLVEQAILNLSKQVDNFIEESSLVKELDGFQSRIDKKLDILQEAISKLTNQFVHQEEENLEEECLTETILVEQAQLQPQEELKMESVEAPEELQDAPESSVNFWPWIKEEHTSALISEEGSGKEIVEDPQKHILQPIPTNPTANAKITYNPLLVAPSDDQVYILPTPAEKSKPATPAPKAKSNPLSAAPSDSVFILPMPAAQPKPQASTTKATPSLLVMQNIRRLVASVQAFATTSKTMATAYIA